LAAPGDISSLLQERLRVAKQRNPKFSLRSFAQQLGIDHSTLSQVLRRKRRLSPGSLETIGKRLGLSETMLGGETRSARKTHNADAAPIPATYNFDLDTFQILTEWYHFAILELLHIDEFKPDSRWIAKTLGLDIQEVNIALQRLLRLGLLQMEGRKRWIDKSGDAEFHSAALTPAAADQINRDVQGLATAAIARTPGRYRLHRHSILAIHMDDLPRVKRLTDEFFDELRRLANKRTSKTDVYQVEISAFPLTTLKSKKGEK
jgi:uncharacterized protein (TIGR02147 family)